MGFFTTSETKTLGMFQEKEHGHWFEYRLTENEWGGKETVKFILITIEDAPGYSTFWWVLS